MGKFGLLGQKLGHSFSKIIHSYLGNYEYEMYEVENEDKIGDFIKNSKLDGFNVTIPYKKAIMNYVDVLSDAAKEIGSINTVYIRDGVVYGDNSDYYGFMYTIKKSGVDIKNKKALVIGNGGASRAIVYALKLLGADVHILSHKDNNETGIVPYLDSKIIVNATPVGMYPNNGISPIDLSKFKKVEYVYDLIYNPKKTRLLLDADNLNIGNMNGLMMLVAQAKMSSEKFQNKDISEKEIDRIEKIISDSTESIVLIGMPGCGKTTVGTLLSKKLSKKFIDSDIEISNKYSHPKDIITNEGEEKFRLIETEILSDICKNTASVIATGGGIVTKDRNFDIVRQNGRVVFIDRSIEKLETKDRPLSKNLFEMYEKRLPMYNKFASVKVDGNGTPKQTLKNIMEALDL